MEVGSELARRSVSAVKHSRATKNIFAGACKKPKALPISLLGPQTNYNSGAHLSGRQPPLVTGFSAWMLAVLNSRESSYVPT